MKAEFWAADTFRFSVTGPGAFRFLNRAAASGVRLRRVRWQKDGYTATASGPDRRRLEEIAKSGGWAFTVTARRGPGRRGPRRRQERSRPEPEGRGRRPDARCRSRAGQ